MSPNITRRGLLGGTAAVVGGALLGPAAAASARTTAEAAPRLYTRAEWRARAPRVAATVLDRAPDRIVVHHTATPNAADHSLEHAFGLSRSIQNFHMDSNGWDDTGQQLTISRGGHLMEGRNRSLQAINAGNHVVGAHTGGHNSHTIGIENEGLYMTEAPTAALWDELVATCAWLCGVYGLDPRTAIVGHRDYNATACPGDTLYALLPQLRDQVAAGPGAARLKVTARVEASGLPGPRHRFDHGPTGTPAR
ncbi:peptidoglycan recognition family protein [Actinomadura sp. WMMB 499]|uniref:peptidoglycan recognition protein family protein n=1 Tax=Actinomadura sp. WMMB 499 TaxID=1219491 RepID=UPI0012443E69|nr:peptidoglycan recognition family protein [Actinomadura sp. WMMB 499]QFG23074.1 N-acetylmuramoyl-L-alanine amidase [Actinomadura sp. WMMB 499]